MKLSKIASDAKNSVERKIQEGFYDLADYACFCGSSECLEISERDRYGLYYPFVVCKRCGIMRANRMMTLNSYQRFYNDEYRTLYGDDDVDRNKLYKLGIKQGREIYEYITEYLPLNSGTVFDIGCNMGTMLLPFYVNGFEVFGVDYGSKNIEFGREKTGMQNLMVGGVERLTRLDKKADLVILNHVLEHFLDLEKELKDIWKIMKPGAYMYISLPGTFWWIKNICKGNVMGLLQNAHVWQFSLTSLTYVMECCGFELILGDEKIKAIFKISNIDRKKCDIPKQEFRRAIDYLKRVERRYLLRRPLIKLLEMLHIKKAIKRISTKLKELYI